MRLLQSRISLGDDDADGVLIESFEAAFALQILQNDARSTFATKCLCRMGIRALKWGLIDRH
jgi:hypothetical protein